jgi:hypothetical protein
MTQVDGGNGKMGGSGICRRSGNKKLVSKLEREPEMKRDGSDGYAAPLL